MIRSGLQYKDMPGETGQIQMSATMPEVTTDVQWVLQLLDGAKKRSQLSDGSMRRTSHESGISRKRRLLASV